MKNRLDGWNTARVLLVGLGLHGGGAATVRWLAKHGARVRVSDMKSATELRATLQKLRAVRGVTYALGRQPRAADLRWASMIVISPAVPADADWLSRVSKTTPVMNVATLFFRLAPGPIIGVTGTRGKTTTTLLIGEILKRARRPVAVAGVRESALLDVLDKLTPRHIAVLELSSYQLEWLPTVRRSPYIAVLTNIKVDHLSRHGTLSNYAKIKFHLLRYQTPKDISVLNADNAWMKKAATLTAGRVIWYSRRGPVGDWSIFIKRNWLVERRGRRTLRLFPLTAWKLPGTHQQENLLAAVAAGRAAGTKPKIIQAAVRRFSGAPHRQEKIRTWRGHDFINDTTATNPDGALAAFEVYPRAVFIVGGTDKQLDFRLMAEMMVKKNIPAVFLPGSATDKLRSLLRRAGYRGQHTEATSMEEAVGRAVSLAKPKQPIVLSPGAASFGLFVHEFDRGDAFVKAVKRLR